MLGDDGWVSEPDASPEAGVAADAGAGAGAAPEAGLAADAAAAA